MAKETPKEIRERKEIEESIRLLIKEQTKDLASYLSLQRELIKHKKNQLEIETELKGVFKKNGEFTKNFLNKNQNITKEQKEHLLQQRDLLKISKLLSSEYEKQLGTKHAIRAALGSIEEGLYEISGINVRNELSFISIAKYLVEQQKSLKQLNLQLGISGEKADFMSKSIRDAAFQTQVLGIGIKELTELQSGLAEETGLVRIYATEQLEALSQIAASTKLGTVETGKMAGMYENLGISILGTHEQVQSILDQSERLGVNAQNVMNSVTKNFKAAQKFYFKGGVASMSKMAIFAEKWKLSMESTLESMEKARTLEGVVEMTQNLRVLGGEFSKLDPFKILYQSRNEGEKFQETIKNLTRGTAFFNKELGQFQVSAVGMDVLREASKALGIPLEELKTTAIRVSEVDMMKKSMPGFARMDKELREIIESQAKWNQKTKEFEITDPLNPNKTVGIRKVTREQLKSFQAGQQSLEDRAKQAIAFDDALKNLTNTIKAAFLPFIPMLNSVASGLQWVTEGLQKLHKGWVIFGAIAIPLIASFGGTLISSLMTLGKLNIQMKILGGSMGKLSVISKGMKGTGGIMGSLFGGISSAGMLKGAAAIFVLGASLVPFAFAMKMLGESTDKGKSFAAIAGGLLLLTGAAIGLGALMATGFGGVGLALGVAAIAALGASLIPLAHAMKELSESNMPDIGEGFKTISTSVNAINSDKLEELRKTAESLKNLSATAGMFGGLGKLFAEGIEVKFKDNQVKMVANITAQLDKDILVRKLSEPISVEIESGNAFLQRKIGG